MTAGEKPEAMHEFSLHLRQAAIAGAVTLLALLPLTSFMVLGLGKLLDENYWLSSLIVTIVLIAAGVFGLRRAFHEIRHGRVARIAHQAKLALIYVKKPVLIVREGPIGTAAVLVVVGFYVGRFGLTQGFTRLIHSPMGRGLPRALIPKPVKEANRIARAKHPSAA